ncbi:hypothetical protein ASPZODRAFT_105543 [Penicilliopsis zonata CBS 506.65]|uniref:MACPF-like domain-containing protein n=1 Tax=Penicilliopsis zonata CBS 506.65 TaxID=1073090 RepID=A0A1L9S534_9EURO|nr:hypothetical protein ASPZODRAFT_105543 [Penicilliopsis zonata CBS 506.65]OJJ42264.1 hypothetical protein ASPZODRAFT_105543 [Penicilliopsis zonata CBS 506.65]
MASLVQNATTAASDATTAATTATTAAATDVTTAVTDATTTAATTTTVLSLGTEIDQFLTSLASESTQVLHVYSYNSQTRVIKETSCIPSKNLDASKMKLSDIRELLLSENILEPRLVWSAFCNQRGAKVLDTTKFQSYLDILNEKSSEVGEISEDNADTYRVYLKSEKVIDLELQSLFSRGMKATIDHQLPAAAQPKSPDMPTSFSHNIFLNPTTTFSIIHPADMSETHWSVVIRNNSLLNAYRVIGLGGSLGKVVERSMHTAFALKPRVFLNYQISATAASDSIPKKKQMLRIPRFRIEDDSYIEQFEKTKSVSRAIAQNSLSQLAAELAISGGAFGFSASLSASYSQDDSSSSSSSSSAETKEMTITYNFPRVVVDFDEDSLELSEECKFDLMAVDSVAAIDRFKDKYGRFYVTRVELGGRLHSSQESTSTSETAKADQAKSMRAAAALSFSSPYVQASANVSYAKSTSSSSEESSSASSNAVCWEAKGGDTLLCNDPPAWAYTVGSFYNWRAVKQSRVMSIEDAISSIPGYQGIKQKFATILKGQTATPSTTQVSVGFQIASPEGDMVFTVPTSSSDYAQEAFSYVNRTAVTDERIQFLHKLTTSISGATLLTMETNSVAANQKFYVNIENTSADDPKQVCQMSFYICKCLSYDGQLKFNHPYRIYTKNGDDYSWLSSSPAKSGYLILSFIWSGKVEEATRFRFLNATNLSSSDYIENGDPVFMVMMDREGGDIGNAEYFRLLNGRIGQNIEAPQGTSSCEYRFKYP